MANEIAARDVDFDWVDLTENTRYKSKQLTDFNVFAQEMQVGLNPILLSDDAKKNNIILSNSFSILNQPIYD